MLPTTFKLLTGDVSGFPATFYRCTSPHYDCFDLYEVNQWADLDSSAIPTHGKYNVQAGRVSLDNRTTIDAALKCSGFRLTASGSIETEEGEAVAAYAKTLGVHRLIAECLWTYGAKEVVLDISGNNLRKLTRQARNAL
jgi:hypothetical protein